MPKVRIFCNHRIAEVTRPALQTPCVHPLFCLHVQLAVSNKYFSSRLFPTNNSPAGCFKQIILLQDPFPWHFDGLACPDLIKQLHTPFCIAAWVFTATPIFIATKARGNLGGQVACRFGEVIAWIASTDGMRCGEGTACVTDPYVACLALASWQSWRCNAKAARRGANHHHKRPAVQQQWHPKDRLGWRRWEARRSGKARSR